MSMSMFHVPCSMSLLHSLCIPHATPSCSCAASPGWYIVHRAVQVFRLPKPHRGLRSAQVRRASPMPCWLLVLHVLMSHRGHIARARAHANLSQDGRNARQAPLSSSAKKARTGSSGGGPTPVSARSKLSTPASSSHLGRISMPASAAGRHDATAFHHPSCLHNLDAPRRLRASRYSCFGQLVAACTRRNSREHQRGCRGRDVPRGDCCDRHRGLIARSGVQGFVRLASHSGICVSNRAAPPPVIERQLTRVEIRKKKFVDALVGQTARARCVRRFIVAAEACASWPVRAGGRPGVNEPHELAHETDRTHRVGARALGS